MDKGMATDAICLDFCKAVDRLPPSILLSKLERFDGWTVWSQKLRGLEHFSYGDSWDWSAWSSEGSGKILQLSSSS